MSCPQTEENRLGLRITNPIQSNEAVCNSLLLNTDTLDISTKQ